MATCRSRHTSSQVKFRWKGRWLPIASKEVPSCTKSCAHFGTNHHGHGLWRASWSSWVTGFPPAVGIEPVLNHMCWAWTGEIPWKKLTALLEERKINVPCLSLASVLFLCSSSAKCVRRIACGYNLGLLSSGWASVPSLHRRAAPRSPMTSDGLQHSKAGHNLSL